MANINIDNILKDGFPINDPLNNVKDLAFSSLKIAIKAYFSTTRAMRLYLDSLESSDLQDVTYPRAYAELCAECIIHFQHFIELVIKDFLRTEHPLLAANAIKYPVILKKLLSGQPITDEEENKLQSLEARDSLESLCTLIKSGHRQTELSFIVDSKNWITHLNNLRNRLWHRGTFVLRYKSLDYLVGGYILPFLFKLFSLPDYNSKFYLWKHRNLACSIDPLHEIVNEITSKQTAYSLKKVAWLKELGRASYEVPKRGMFTEDTSTGAWLDLMYEEDKKRLNKLLEVDKGYDIKHCPVCDEKSLVIIDDTDGDIDELHYENTGEQIYTDVWEYSWLATCRFCEFEVERRFKNASEHSLNIEDYFYSRMLSSS